MSAHSARVSEGEWTAQRVYPCQHLSNIISSPSLSGERYTPVSYTDTTSLAALLFLTLLLFCLAFTAVRGPIKYVPPNPTPVHSSELVTEATSAAAHTHKIP